MMRRFRGTLVFVITVYGCACAGNCGSSGMSSSKSDSARTAPAPALTAAFT